MSWEMLEFSRILYNGEVLIHFSLVFMRLDLNTENSGKLRKKFKITEHEKVSFDTNNDITQI